MLKLVSFLQKGNRNPQVGVLLGDKGGVLDVGGELLRKKLSMMDLIGHKSSESYITSINERIASKSYDSKRVFDVDKVKICAPLMPHRNVFCIGKNYSDHIAEVNASHEKRNAGGDGSNTPAPVAVEGNKYPVWFTKAPQCVIGPHPDKIESHKKLTRWLDYEVELAIIIGKKGRDIKPEDAFSHIFGYTVGNDVTARDVQKRHIQWFKGKSLDNTCPLGPAIVPHSEMVSHGVHPGNLRVTTHVNGELRQDSRTSNLIFDIPAQIASLSAGFTLLPGDVILTGTPSGVGFAMDPPQVLKPKDEVVVAVEHIGALKNLVK